MSSDFIHHQCDWFSSLSKAKSIPGPAREFLRTAISRGAYLTGGAARQLAYSVFAEEGVFDKGMSGSYHDEPWLMLQAYLGQYRSYAFNQTAKTNDPMWKASMSDIDLFFRDQKTATDFVTDMTTAKVASVVKMSPAGYGMDFLVADRGGLFQCITKITGRPEDVVSNFDLANAKVFLDSDGIHHPSGWLELERDSTLGIDDHTKNSLLWRTTKWMRKHNYKKIRLQDQDKLIDNVFALLEKAKTSNITRFGAKIGKAQVLCRSKNFIGALDPLALLKLSAMFDTYTQLHMLKNITS